MPGGGARPLDLGRQRRPELALTELTSGSGRFGAGAFEQPIRILIADELGDVARPANQMAASLKRLGEERERVETALKVSNRELEAFSYAVAHDLRAPLRGINGFSQALLEDHGDKLDAEGKDQLSRIAAGAGRMGQLIDALLALSRVTRTELQHEAVNLSLVADAVMKQLRASQPERALDFELEEGVVGYGDAPLVRAVLENLLGNAWKFTSGRAGARIAFGSEETAGARVYYVRDNGAGFDMAYAEKLFALFSGCTARERLPGRASASRPSSGSCTATAGEFGPRVSWIRAQRFASRWHPCQERNSHDR